MDKKNNLLIILAVCFIMIFAVVIISVNNWLRQTLREETISSKQAAVVYSEKSKYVQKPIEIVPVQQSPVAVQKKTAIPKGPVGSESKGIVPEPPPAGEKVLIN